jgi:hypothetical protein
MATQTDRLGGAKGSLAFKAPCRVATTANITLSGLQAIAGVTVAEGDRVLVKNQTAASENGVRIASTGPWLRAKDFDGTDDFVTGTRVYVHSGSNGPAEYAVTSADPIEIGEDDITFVRTGNGNTVGATGAESGNLVEFDGATGLLLRDSGYSVAEIIAAAIAAALTAVRDGVAGAYDTLAELAAGKLDKAGDTMTGALTLAAGFFQTGVITPSQITSNTNDYAPTSFSTASVVLLSTDAAWRIITGLAGGASGRRITLRNSGSHPILLSDANTSSAAANRFGFGASIVLLANESCELRYDGSASRWREVTSVAGSRKARRLASDTVNDNVVANTLADLSGLSFWMEASKTYEFRVKCSYTAAATTTGSRWTVNGPAAPTLITYASEYTLTAITQTVNYQGAYQAPAASNLSSLTTGNIAIIEGVVRNGSTAGLLQAQFASEVSASAITALAAGSIIEWREVA